VDLKISDVHTVDNVPNKNINIRFAFTGFIDELLHGDEQAIGITNTPSQIIETQQE
jgi:hypothetical protein